MAQSQWTYHGASGRPHHIGLYHGDESGHVIIYCNNSILTIDFDVEVPKSYSFYLEHDLCELSIKQEEETFAYDFKIVRPDESAEEKDSSEHFDYLYVLLATVLFLAIIISFAIAI